MVSPLSEGCIPSRSTNGPTKIRHTESQQAFYFIDLFTVLFKRIQKERIIFSLLFKNSPKLISMKLIRNHTIIRVSLNWEKPIFINCVL